MNMFTDQFWFFIVVVIIVILVSIQYTLNKIYRLLNEIKSKNNK